MRSNIRRTKKQKGWSYAGGISEAGKYSREIKTDRQVGIPTMSRGCHRGAPHCSLCALCLLPVSRLFLLEVGAEVVPRLFQTCLLGLLAQLFSPTSCPDCPLAADAQAFGDMKSASGTYIFNKSSHVRT